MLHSIFFNGEVGFLFYLSIFSPKNLFESNPRLIYCCHAIKPANIQSEISLSFNNYISNIHGLKLCVQSLGDVSKLEEFLDGGEYGRDRILKMVCHILDNVFAFKKLVGDQLTVVVLEVSQPVLHGIID